MKLSDNNMEKQGRIIARAMDRIKVEKKKSMMEAVTRRETMLHDAAEKELFGNNIK